VGSFVGSDASAIPRTTSGQNRLEKKEKARKVNER
jgi:hypothetical protein